MATFTADVLTQIQLANAKGDIYNPGVKAQVHTILLHNINSSAEDVEIFHHDGSLELRYWKVNLVANETLLLTYPGPGYPINASSKITGNADTASKVTCSVIGSLVT